MSLHACYFVTHFTHCPWVWKASAVGSGSVYVPWRGPRSHKGVGYLGFARPLNRSDFRVDEQQGAKVLPLVTLSSIAKVWLDLGLSYLLLIVLDFKQRCPTFHCWLVSVTRMAVKSGFFSIQVQREESQKSRPKSNLGP